MKLDTAHVKAQSRLATVRAGKRYTEDDEFEGAPFKWRVITRGEKQECQARALARFEELKIPYEFRGYQDVEDETLVQVLAEAMRDADEPDRAFAGGADELRTLLTVDEIAALWSRYADFEDKVNPSLDVGDFASAIEQDVKKKDVIALMSYGSVLLANYLLYMEDPPQT